MGTIQKALQIILISHFTALKSTQSTNSIRECNIEKDKKIKLYGQIEISVDFCFNHSGISMKEINEIINDHFESSANVFYGYFGVEFEKNINFLNKEDFGDEKNCDKSYSYKDLYEKFIYIRNMKDYQKDSQKDCRKDYQKDCKKDCQKDKKINLFIVKRKMIDDNFQYKIKSKFCGMNSMINLGEKNKFYGQFLNIGDSFFYQIGLHFYGGKDKLRQKDVFRTDSYYSEEKRMKICKGIQKRLEKKSEKCFILKTIDENGNEMFNNGISNENVEYNASNSSIIKDASDTDRINRLWIYIPVGILSFAVIAVFLAVGRVILKRIKEKRIEKIMLTSDFFEDNIVIVPGT